jgi:ACS family hexuronate transporter-like MFS transporter
MFSEMLHAVAPEIGKLFGGAVVGFLLCRILLGLGEGGVSPAVIKAIAEWFPKRERALATGVASGASSLGGMLVPWLLPFLLVQFSGMALFGVTLGWRCMFLLTGGIDILLVVIWMTYYRNPEEHLRVNAAELVYIQSDSAAEPVTKIPWRKLLPHRQTWSFIIAKSLTDGFWWFYLFGSPDFFNRKFNLGPGDRAYMLMSIYLVSALGAVASGWLSAKLMKRGWSVNRTRKITMLVCALFSMPVFYSAITTNKWLAAALITTAATCHQAWGASVFCLAGDMFPKRAVGSLIGIAGVCSTGASMLLMYLTGQIVSMTGTYLPIFCMASAAYMLAILLSHLLAPRLSPVNIEQDLCQVPAGIGVGSAAGI